MPPNGIGRTGGNLRFWPRHLLLPCGVISTTEIAVVKLMYLSASRHFNDDLTNHVLT